MTGVVRRAALTGARERPEPEILAAAAALVVVRQVTPGMLLAGVRFREPVPASRLPHVLLAALLGVVTLGSIGALGARISPLAAAAASVLESDDSI